MEINQVIFEDIKVIKKNILFLLFLDNTTGIVPDFDSIKEVEYFLKIIGYKITIDIININRLDKLILKPHANHTVKVLYDCGRVKSIKNKSNGVSKLVFMGESIGYSNEIITDKNSNYTRFVGKLSYILSKLDSTLIDNIILYDINKQHSDAIIQAYHAHDEIYSINDLNLLKIRDKHVLALQIIRNLKNKLNIDLNISHNIYLNNLTDSFKILLKYVILYKNINHKNIFELASIIKYYNDLITIIINISQDDISNMNKQERYTTCLLLHKIESILTIDS